MGQWKKIQVRNILHGMYIKYKLFFSYIINNKVVTISKNTIKNYKIT